MAAEVQRLEASGTAVFVPDDAYVWLPATVSSVHDDVCSSIVLRERCRERCCNFIHKHTAAYI